MRTITLTNVFHGTKVTLQARPSGRCHILSRRQVLRARNALCGMSDCKCGGTCGERGPQTVELEPCSDGTVEVWG